MAEATIHISFRESPDTFNSVFYCIHESIPLRHKGHKHSAALKIPMNLSIERPVGPMTR